MTRDTTATEQPIAALRHLVVVNRGRVLGVVVAPLAEERQLRHQHAVVVRAMRIVAGRAAFTVDAGVLEQERSALLRVARRARFVDAVAGAQQLDVGRAMRVVAGRALHLAFAHGHVAGAIELGDLVAMAVHAQLLLVGRLQLRGRGQRVMDAVARGARHVARFVLAAFPQRVDALVVASGARLADGLGRCTCKRVRKNPPCLCALRLLYCDMPDISASW